MGWNTLKKRLIHIRKHHLILSFTANIFCCSLSGSQSRSKWLMMGFFYANEPLKLEKNSQGYLKPPLCNVICTYRPFMIQQTSGYMATLSDSSHPSLLSVAYSPRWHLLKVISSNIINLDKHSASPINTADSDLLHTAQHTTTHRQCVEWFFVFNFRTYWNHEFTSERLNVG